MNEIRIAQITDLHIPPEGEHPFDTNPRENLLAVLDQLEDYDPHHVVLSGDLSFHDGDPDACRWIKKQIESLDVPYSVIGGNHDISKVIADVYDHNEALKGDELYFESNCHGQSILNLDSAKGQLSNAQKEWLNDSLQAGEGLALIFIHHPPCVGGVPHMDNNYPLQDRDEVLDILKHSNRECQVFCGHYHVEKTLTFDNVSIHITPSLFIQLSSSNHSFEIEHKIAGWRHITIKDDKLDTGVKYLS